MEENICSYCKAGVSQVEVHCENCGFPLIGTEKEKAIWIGRQTMRKSKIDNSAKMVGKTRIILYVLAGFQVLNAILVYVKFSSIIDVVFYLVVAALLATFGYLSPKKPILFVSLALCVMLGYYFLLYLADPILLYSGILWKCAIVMALLYTLYDAIESHNLKKKYKL
ncbi:hypothetical protein H2O64_20230 [Kordia sp. YSTF-M3]|uniref:Zinc ribbon domain-containing protein n=1 Tax=Kordia aestuariivivens TaxID=2759037 RepID=A0ABR7QF60_9FLAO|nr:hypothetical protein [Kordia aestuariivivens]MBC8757011.1 hypothetical protein [Kordia aestuariivivens]